MTSNSGATVLVVGGGGREHAIAWRLARSQRVGRVVIGPGNAGTGAEPGCENIHLDTSNVAAIISAARGTSADLVVVGPEGPLVAGAVDALSAAGIPAFGPSAAAAQLEGSKSHCKDFLVRHGIPTGRASAHRDAESALAALADFDEPPVVKACGLAAGKGVIVADTFDSASDAIHSILVDRRFGEAGVELLLEERLRGTELSVLAFCDGEHWSVMPAAQDHKRLMVGDIGPNTGGMGAFVPSPVADAALVAEIERTVIAPTMAGMTSEGRPYRGVLYAGLMLTTDGPKVIEFNCRFGDPETQVVLPLLESDPLEIFEACASGSLAGIEPRWSDQAAVTVVMASAGYPESSSGSVPIAGLDRAAESGCTVFHAGTRVGPDGEVLTAGGRVLAVTAVADQLGDAAERAHAGVAAIEFEGSQHRNDIALATAEVRS